MEQRLIADDAIEVVILPEIGARLHRLRVLGHDLLRTPDDVAEHVSDPFFWGAFVMAPWCNRIDAGPVAVGSRRMALAPNFSDGSAIHGQVFARRWEAGEDGRFTVRAGGDGWPWEYEVGMQIEVLDRSVHIEQALTNLAEDPMPAGIGLHPWFRRPLLVAIRGDAVHRDNTMSEPWPEAVRGPFDLREIGEMQDGLDATWAQLADPPVELRWPNLGLRATMRITAQSTYVVAASPSNLDAIAVEPETHAPQGIRRMFNGEPGSMTLLDPGATLNLRVEMDFERLDNG